MAFLWDSRLLSPGWVSWLRVAPALCLDAHWAWTLGRGTQAWGRGRDPNPGGFQPNGDTGVWGVRGGLWTVGSTELHQAQAGFLQGDTVASLRRCRVWPHGAGARPAQKRDRTEHGRVTAAWAGPAEARGGDLVVMWSVQEPWEATGPAVQSLGTPVPTF